jgi:hypothetical protein
MVKDTQVGEAQSEAPPKSGVSHVLFILWVIELPFAGFLMKSVYDYHVWAITENAKDPTFNAMNYDPYQLWICVFTAAVMFPLREWMIKPAIDTPFQNCLLEKLDLSEYDLEPTPENESNPALQKKVQELKATLFQTKDWFCGLCWWVTSTCLLVCLATGSNSHPSCFGGLAEDCDNHLLHWPQTYENIPWANEFFLIQIGTHLYSLIMHFYHHYHSKDFLDMLFHHFNTMYMCVFTYFGVGPGIGTISLGFHDFTDVPFFGGRMLKELGILKGAKLVVAFIVILATYFWGRIWMNTSCVLGSTWRLIWSPKWDADPVPYQMVMYRWVVVYLFVLMVLQVLLSGFWMS